MKQQNQQNRYRVRYTFWLDLEKEEEELLADKIELLKNERSFAPVVRSGIKIVSDLKEGKLDALLEEYPWIQSALGTPQKKQEIKQLPTTTVTESATNSNGTEEFMDMFADFG